MSRISMLDVAKAAGVSKNAVSLALRSDPQIPEATRLRIQQVADSLGYRRNATVSHLMAQLRAGAASGYKATLALINANQSATAFTTHPTIPTYVAGCRRYATQHGYELDEFWLHEPGLTGVRLNKTLRARGIRGVLIVGLMRQNQFPEHFLPTWQQFPCVVTGVRTRHPALSFACVDHHMLTLHAVKNALRLGYKRLALVIDGVIDELVEHRFTAGFTVAQQAVPQARRIKPFYAVTEARRDRSEFVQWLKTHKPDVILTLYHAVRSWVEDAGYRVPEQMGVISLERRADYPDWAGMDQHNDIVGEAAVSMLISMIHQGENGIPAFPRATLIDSTWVEGGSVMAPSTVT